jgi:hypothetical protein
MQGGGMEGVRVAYGSGSLPEQCRFVVRTVCNVQTLGILQL